MLTIEEIKNKMLSFDKNFATIRIVSAIKQYFSKTGAKKGIIGISGGVDSSVTLALLIRAIGNENIFALLLPHGKITPKQDVNDAIELVESYGVNYEIIEIDNVVNKFMEELEGKNIEINNIVRGNIIARSRMIILYSYANAHRGLVVGSGDKSELLIGYFTKYGDGGVDILPIGDLYKLQVRELAIHLGLDEKIAYKPSSPGLWPGQTAESELGISYNIIDSILYAFIEMKLPLEQLIKIKDINQEVILSIIQRVLKTEHKRRFPFIPKLSPSWTIGIDWRVPRISNIKSII